MVDSAIAIYYTTKHSWRGKYKRLFAITPDGVATFNPQNPTDITNKVINLTHGKNLSCHRYV